MSPSLPAKLISNPSIRELLAVGLRAVEQLPAAVDAHCAELERRFPDSPNHEANRAMLMSLVNDYLLALWRFRWKPYRGLLNERRRRLERALFATFAPNWLSVAWVRFGRINDARGLSPPPLWLLRDSIPRHAPPSVA